MPGILLGNIQFVDREVPDTIKWGGRQMLAVHRVMGGNRVIDTIGPDPAPIGWSGLFLGKNSSKRARQCDELRKSGTQVNLTWGTFRYLVVVSEFTATYKHEWEVRYSIKCEVVSDLNSQAPISIQSIFTQDFAGALAVAQADPAAPATPGSVSVPSNLLTSIQDAQAVFNNAAGDGSISDVSLTQLQPVIQSVNSAFATLDATIGSPPNGIDLSAPTATSVIDGINSFAAEVTTRSVESDLEVVRAYLGRIAGNLDSAGG